MSVIVGGWCALFAGYAHVACQNSTTPGAGSYQDGGIADGAGGGGPSDSSTSFNDSSSPINDSGGGGSVGLFAGTSGPYSSSATGCGITTFTLAVGSTIVANGFGDNGAVTFTLKSGSDKIAEAKDLTIFGEDEHTCQLEVGQAGIGLSCTNPGGGSCGPQPFTKN